MKYFKSYKSFLNEKESVNEAKFNKAKLLKALGNNDDGYIIVKGKKYIIYNRLDFFII